MCMCIYVHAFMYANISLTISVISSMKRSFGKELKENISLELNPQLSNTYVMSVCLILFWQ